MTFTEIKNNTLRPQKEKWLSTFLFALLTAAFLFLPYIIIDGGYFIFYGDYNVQQIPFYQLCHKMIKEGSFAFNPYTDLGADFIASYSFYTLGSPFFWMTLPFPNEFVPYLVAPLLILKFALSALTSYFYIRRFTRRAETARLGALLYAFSGFSVYNIFFNHFHEAIVFFPLLLLGLELLITENKRGVFALSVGVCAISNYFFFFGMVVFTVIYFIVRVASKAVRVPFSRFLVVVFEAVLGLLFSAVLLLPSLSALMENSRLSEFLLGWNGILYGKEQIYLNIIECFFFPPDIPARPVFFPGADVKWSSLGGFLPLFSMVGVFTLFFSKRKSWLKKIIGICAFMALVPILNSAFYAFNDAYYARWFYMPILMMSLATVMMCEDKEADFNRGFRWVFGITVAIAAVIGFFPEYDENKKIKFGLYTEDESNVYMIRFFIAVAIAIIGLLILKMLLSFIKKAPKSFYAMATACVIFITVIYGNVYIISGRSHSYDIKGVMIEDLIEAEMNLPEDEEFRIDTYDGVDNTAMFLGYSGINAFHSVVPSSIVDFYTFVGEERIVASRPEVENYALRSLLSVKYLLNRADGESFVDNDGKTLMPNYEYLRTENDYYVYENKSYIPFGFTYDYYMNYDFCESYTPSSRASLMLKAILLSDDQIEKYGGLMTDIKTLENDIEDSEEADNELDTNEADANEVESNEVESSEVESSEVESSEVESSEVESSEVESSEVESNEPQIEIVDSEAVSLTVSEENYIKDCERQSKKAAESFHFDKNGFNADITLNKKSLVFFSVPFMEGWTATVNGEPAQIERVNEGFMAVVAEKGVNYIEFSYETPLLWEGMLISAGAIVVFLIYFIISFFYVKKNPHKNGYPEGEALLNDWRQGEILDELSEREEEPHKESILDDTPIQIPPINKGFEGGFNIDLSQFQEKDD